MKLFFYLIIVLFIISCSEDDNSKTSFSGLIQNPTHENIYISDGQKVLDTIGIKKDGSFKKVIDIKESNFLVFNHPPEYQTFYIEPGDSLSFRLNTMDFDKSLVFSGDSSAENNFLMDMYLMNEANNDLILSYYKTTPDAIIDKTDSIRTERFNKLKQLDKKHDFSENFLNIAKKSINYELYDIRERYSFLLKNYFPDKAKSLNDSFYDYRDSINFNDTDLISHFGYLRFLDDFLKNRSVDKCLNNNDLSREKCFELNSFNNVHQRLKLVNSIFEHQGLKNKFLERFFAKELVYATTNDQLNMALGLLNDVEIDDNKKEELKEFAEFHRTFVEGQQIDELPLKNHNKDTIALKSLADKPYTAIHVWSCNMPAVNEKRFELINKLREKYEKINFVGINTDYNNYNLWQQNVADHNLIRHHELQALNTKNSEYYNYYLNRFTLINSEGDVIAADILNTEKEIKSFIVNNTKK